MYLVLELPQPLTEVPGARPGTSLNHARERIEGTHDVYSYLDEKPTFTSDP